MRQRALGREWGKERGRDRPQGARQKREGRGGRERSRGAGELDGGAWGLGGLRFPGEGKNSSEGGLTRELRKRARKERRETEKREPSSREGAEGGGFTIKVESNRKWGSHNYFKGKQICLPILQKRLSCFVDRQLHLSRSEDVARAIMSRSSRHISVGEIESRSISKDGQAELGLEMKTLGLRMECGWQINRKEET